MGLTTALLHMIMHTRIHVISYLDLVREYQHMTLIKLSRNNVVLITIIQKLGNTFNSTLSLQIIQDYPQCIHTTTC